MSDQYYFTSGPYTGAVLFWEGDVLMLEPPAGAHRKAPLRALASAYPRGAGPWPWLRAHGIRRPSPSGSKSKTQDGNRSTVQVPLRMADEDRARLDALASYWDVTRSEAVLRMLAQVVDELLPITRQRARALGLLEGD